MGALKMIVSLAQLILLLSTSAFTNPTHVIGTFGNQRIPIDFEFGDNIMMVTTHKPLNAPDTFRETNNLHMFASRLVAIRNSLDKECYVQHFNATRNGMEERVENAVQNKRNLGEIKEERVTVAGLQALTSKTVKYFLGPEIAKFCNLHDVYLITDENSQLLDPNGDVLKKRGRRFALRNSRRWNADVIGDYTGGNGGNGPRWPKSWKDFIVVC